MATYIVNVHKREVHISANVTTECSISTMRDNHRVDTDQDYSEGFNPFARCPHCYIEMRLANEA